MTKYKVFWKDQFIGVLSVENGYYNYIPDKKAIEGLKNEAFLVAEVMSEYEGRPIQFFKQLIDNCSRFEGRSLAYHNNNYCLKVE